MTGFGFVSDLATGTDWAVTGQNKTLATGCSEGVVCLVLQRCLILQRCVSVNWLNLKLPVPHWVIP